MRIAAGKSYTAWEWILLFTLLAITTIATRAFGLSRNLSDAVIYTVVIFAVVITALRPAWGRPTFWRNLALIFVLHLIAVLVFLRTLPNDGHGVPGVPMIIAGTAEALLVGGTLWKRAVRSKHNRRE
jgi:hypothetical protein